jgi:predicted nucleic acid-binding protein
VKVLSDASPLISLAEIGHLEVLPQLYAKITITAEVYREVVVAGDGLVGALQIATASWIEVREAAGPMPASREKWTLGRGELATIALAKEMGADLTLIDDFGARRLAEREGLIVFGCVGVLESAFRRGFLSDLTGAYRKLVASDAYISVKILSASLSRLKQPPL